jgi:hypothetical protein
LPPTCVKSTLIWLNSEPVMKLAKNTMITCAAAGCQACCCHCAYMQALRGMQVSTSCTTCGISCGQRHWATYQAGIENNTHVHHAGRAQLICKVPTCATTISDSKPCWQCLLAASWRNKSSPALCLKQHTLVL